MTSEARLLANIAFVVVVDGLLIGACVFAWLKGRTAERTGATLYFAAAVISILLALITGKVLPIVPELFFDGAVAVGFLALALRYNNMWLGAAMLLKGLQLMLHAMHLTDSSDAFITAIGGANAYILALNAVSVLISLTLIGGTAASLRARRRAQAESAALPATAPPVQPEPTQSA